MKGERIIPGNPCSDRGYIPKPEESVLNNTSMILTSHMKKIKIPGMIMLRKNFFL